MKTLKHKGILVTSAYRGVGYTIMVDGEGVQLNDKQEEMAFAWCRKLGTPYTEDPVFKKNFMTDFCNSLGIDYTESINFDQIISDIEKERYRKENMSKEEKKELALQRKQAREKNRLTYGYATVDGKEVEVANYIAEPSSIFMGRGQHPLRGKWKEGPRKEDIVLNLSPDAPRPQGFGKIIWKPKKMWIASWTDKLSGKTKYVWLADTYGKKQDREKKKFDKAITLEKNLEKVRSHIVGNLESSDPIRKRVATACLLIFELNLRVGDEKDEDEADTVGCLTLRTEHISFEGERVIFDFKGKDSVQWHKEAVLPVEARENLMKFICLNSEQPFEGLNSKDVTKFLSEVQDDLTAKVFRTYRATKAFKTFLEERDADVIKYSDASEKLRIILLKQAILQAAKVCNHKKAKSKTYEKSLEKKQEKVDKLLKQQQEFKPGGKKKLKDISDKLHLARTQLEFYKDTSEWNLNTSLKSYVDPRVVVEWAKEMKVPTEKIYSKALQKKFSWVS